MGTLAMLAFGLAYFCFALILPTVLAGRYLAKRGRSQIWTVAVGASSFLLAAIGFWVMMVVAARTVPPGHDLINMNGLFAGVMLAFWVGMPAGGWFGAWSAALLLRKGKA